MSLKNEPVSVEIPRNTQHCRRYPHALTRSISRFFTLSLALSLALSLSLYLSRSISLFLSLSLSLTVGDNTLGDIRPDPDRAAVGYD